MPHAGQVLPLAARRGIAALLAALIAPGCTRTGDVVVMIDSTMQADSVEVVAMSAPPSNASSAARTPAASGDSVARLRALDDSAATLGTRFRDLRAAISREVAALDTMDRRSRSYATRYDAIVRRTREAEQARAARDSTRASAERLRARLGPRAGPVPGAATTADAPADKGKSTVVRRRVRGASATLSLAPGTWWIGVARAGADAIRYDSVAVRNGATDTLDLRGSAPPNRPDPR